jgi:hypothetical protein
LVIAWRSQGSVMSSMASEATPWSRQTRARMASSLGSGRGAARAKVRELDRGGIGAPGNSCRASPGIDRPQQDGQGVGLVVVEPARSRRARMAAMTASLPALPLPVAKRLIVPTGTPS